MMLPVVDDDPVKVAALEGASVEPAMRVLAGRVAALGDRIENLMGVFDERLESLSIRLQKVEKRNLLADEQPDARDMKRPRVEIMITEQEVSYMQSQLIGPVKDAIQELGRCALDDQELALRLLRVGSDKFVATCTLHSKELQQLRDSINWSFLPLTVIEALENRFVKAIAKKVEHTKRKIRQSSTSALLDVAKYGKTEGPFVKTLADLLKSSSEIPKFETSSSSIISSASLSSPNTTASSSDDNNRREAKSLFGDPPTDRYDASSTTTIDLPMLSDIAALASFKTDEVADFSRIATSFP